MKSDKKENFLHQQEDELSRLSKVMGQMSGIEKMLIDERSCPEIIQQLRAAISALKAIELAVVRRHIISTIVKSSQNDSPAQLDKKLKELMAAIKF